MADKALRWLALEGGKTSLIRHLVILLLLALTAQQGAKLTWALLESPPTPAVSLTDLRQQALSQKTSPSETGGDVRTNQAALHLFGEPESILVNEPAPSPVDVPETTLNLTLRGVIAAKPMRKAVAVIGEDNKEDGIYRIGDTVPGNARIKAIYPDRVILERSGKLETLFIEDADRKQNTNLAGPAARGEHLQINRNYLNRKMRNIPELAKEVGVEPHYRDGGQYGYKIVSATNSPFLKNLGLQSGDILYEVNGISLANASQALAAYEKLQDSREIWLEIERDGQRLTKTYSIR